MRTHKSEVSFRIIDRKFNTFKLVLLGLIILVVPILFVLQGMKSNNESKENENLKEQLTQSKSDVARLQSEIQSKNDIIKFYSDVLNKKRVVDTMPITVFDTIKAVTFDKLARNLLVRVSQTTTVSQNVPTGVSYELDTFPLNNEQYRFLFKAYEDYYKVKNKKPN